MELKELKDKIMRWAGGLSIEGETKSELKDSLKQMHFNLECELDNEAGHFEREIDKLDVPEN